jgi:hypothetical protein
MQGLTNDPSAPVWVIMTHVRLVKCETTNCVGTDSTALENVCERTGNGSAEACGISTAARFSRMNG